jgi:hypothetical protein
MGRRILLLLSLRAMSRMQMISLVCAIALTIGGLYWLADILGVFDNSGEFSLPGAHKAFQKVMLVPVMMIILGSYWIWEDLFKPGPRR